MPAVVAAHICGPGFLCFRLIDVNASPCRLQKEKQEAELASAESRGKAAAEVEALQQEVAAAEQRVQAAQVRSSGSKARFFPTWMLRYSIIKKCRLQCVIAYLQGGCCCVKGQQHTPLQLSCRSQIITVQPKRNRLAVHAGGLPEAGGRAS